MDESLLTESFDYTLPPERIAQTPVEPRDASRLLVIRRDTGALEHRHFRDLVELLRPGDLLVANDSRVLPGRLWARKPTGGRVELLLLRPLDAQRWEAFARPAHRLRPGLRLTLVPAPDSPSASDAPPIPDALPAQSVPPPPALPPLVSPPLVVPPTGAPEAGEIPGEELWVEVGERTPAGAVAVRLGAPLERVVARFGHVPLPPYIRAPLADPERYQTVYARVTGSAAAPTAGLHFTPSLLDELAKRGVELAFVTLHVGPDTFRPVRARRVAEHEMHRELVAVPDATALAVRETRRRGGRVVAVGTTAVRALEAWAATAPVPDPSTVPAAAAGASDAPTPAALRDLPEGGWSDWTRLFIVPGYRFRAVDALITNFHLPRSTLLMLVSAFAGRDLIRRAYATAVERGYRFYSFGDATLML